MKKCPCFSGKKYEECCARFHRGEFPSNALELMRSRYAAYALGLAEYIVETTLSGGDLEGTREFSAQTDFTGLDILEFVDGEDNATVTFFAHLFQGGKDVSFIEKSFFKKKDGRWLYLLPKK